jgi:hypothetical protein
MAFLDRLIVAARAERREPVFHGRHDEASLIQLLDQALEAIFEGYEPRRLFLGAAQSIPLRHLPSYSA